MKPWHAAELGLVGGDRGQSVCQAMGGAEQIVGPDWRPRALKCLEDLGVAPISGLVARQDLQGRQHGLQLDGQSLGALLRRPETQLCGDDDAGADPLLAACSDAVADAARGSPHEIGGHVRVEQIYVVRHGGERLEIDRPRQPVVDVREGLVNGVEGCQHSEQSRQRHPPDG